MSSRDIQTCPACTMLFYGPWVICHMCGYSKLEAMRSRNEQYIAELVADEENLMASIKADNDKAEAKDAPVWRDEADSMGRAIDDAWNRGD